MKKKIVLIIILVIIISILSVILAMMKSKDGVLDNDDNLTVEEKDDLNGEDVNLYVDENNTQVSIYTQGKGTLTKVYEFRKKYISKKDIKVFQIYPSSEENLSYSGRFGAFVGNEWLSIDPEHILKQGFTISYGLSDGTIINQMILNPSMTQTNYDYIEIYLYDDYAHRNDSWYSHIEENQFNDKTYFTSIKITAGSKVGEISTPIKLKTFTYDTDDDFDENGYYRGNSSYEISICDLNSTC